ncbi:hypothetical protein BSZ19_03680 [Bradyrhizobium japonicum]|uniref:Uncharacterized protein n=1 Tax=Bradyrhizobium japonicum TaxID=375 RepID=A0A1Y2JWT3_BRAJP|nr:hypothetical protein [Bradyrhizobium japonicum]OSJ36539.1 hypothetical protein BSZ19_03680 [Bradyrhizobium japonicum]
MTDDVDAWEQLGSHKGRVSSLVWSSDAANLYSASYDGEIRKCTADKYERLRASDDKFVWDMSWSACRGEFLASAGTELIAYRRDTISAHDIIVHSMRYDPSGQCLATRERLPGREGEAMQPRLRLHSTETLADESNDPIMYGTTVFSCERVRLTV